MKQNRILIVDDNATNVVILEEILGDRYCLATAAAGEEALSEAAAFRPDLILLDIMMPGMNGYEACRQMRANKALRHSKIIMVSAKALVSERIAGYAAGADDYITKPFDEEELLAKVQIYMRLSYLEEVDKLKTEILTLLNHETCTPLNNIIPIIEVLLEEESMEPGERKRWLTIMRKHATRLHELLDKGIRLSAMKSDAWKFCFTRADLCAIARAAVAEAIPDTEAQSIVIEQLLPASANAVFDVVQMRCVVDAVIENAVRFSPPHGVIQVRVEQNSDSVRLTITDHGPGIASELMPRVFGEFTVADPLHHTVGQGLSLALANQVVLAHGGMIAVDSSKPGETIFSLTLPTAPPRSLEAPLSLAQARRA
jgi:two-component system sensor histidine kinase/response regulator